MSDPKVDPITVKWDGWGLCREITRPGPVAECRNDIGAFGYKMPGAVHGQPERVVCYGCFCRQVLKRKT